MPLVHQFLEASAALTPNKIALICGERYTYAELDRLANQVAHALCALGLERGDRVAIWLPNSVEAVVALFGILKAGGVFVPVNPATKPDKISYLLSDSGARFLIASGRNLAPSSALAELSPNLVAAIACGGPAPSYAIPWATLLTGPAPRPPHPGTIDLDLACLIYTSGSTGEPKGVMSTHANVAFAATAITTYLENVPDDIVINVLPLSFDYGLYQLLMVCLFGGTLVLERSFAFPAAVLRRIAEERVTGLPGVPTLFATLLQMDLDKFPLESLRYLTNTAAALPVAHIQELRRAFPRARVFSMYGLTECKRALYLPPEELDRRPGSVGIPIPGTEAWLEDECGQHVPPGGTGQLVIRGPHVMQGYWNAPELTAARFRPGRNPAERLLYSGDLFRQDEEGFFYFLSRTDDIIKSGGEKVAPKEVEHILYSLPGVAEAAVVGVPDQILGEAVKAIIVPRPGAQLTDRDVLRHCTQHLEPHLVPRIVEFRASLPRTDNGKQDRRLLREPCAASLA